MIKSHPYNKMSNVKCSTPRCNKLIKQRLANKGFKLCYRCYNIERHLDGKSYRHFKRPGEPVTHIPAAHLKSLPKG